MKTLMLRVCYLGLAVSTILASPGTEEQANAETTDPVVNVLPVDPVADIVPQIKIVDADVLAESEVPAPLAPLGGTNAPAAAKTNAPAKPMVLSEPTLPENVNLSPAMADVVKLVQAGVSPDVLMAYITNSTSVFNVDSDVIVYLNDLGVTNSVITALIQHDSSPETAARKASANAVQPLPPGVSTTAPVSNVYPPAANRSFPIAGQTTYPGDITSVTDTNAPVAEAVTAPLTPPAENVTVNYFYSSLAPYGSWVDVDGYGMCWRPTVAAYDPYWRPYCDRGRWLWSDAGWYWYSDYSWGWAPFHYGRWCSYPSMGWIWVPGTVWSPSWVTWRYGGGYCGWAPLPPGCGYHSGIGLTWYGSGVSVGFGFGLGWNCWSYVPTSHFCDWHVRRHCLPHDGIHVVHRNTVAVNNFTGRNGAIVNRGIEPNTIASATRTKIPTMKIRDHALPTDGRTKPERLDNRGDSMAIVRPQLPKTAPAVANPVASRGTATRGQPTSLANNAQASTAKLAPNGNANTVSRGNGNSPLANGAVRNQGNAQRHESASVAPNNSGTQTTARQNPLVRPQQQQQQAATPNAQRQVTQTAPTPNAQRQQAAPSPMARNNVNVNPSPAPAPNTSVGRNLAPPAARQQTAPPSQPAARPAPSQAPSQRSVSPMIRSYAEPRAAAPAPSVRSAPPMAAPSARPQFSAPSSRPSPSYSAPASRPSAPSAPSHSMAPPSSRSAPSSSGSSGGGGGGSRSSSGNSGNNSGLGRR